MDTLNNILLSTTDLSFGERITYGLKILVIGMATVFSVLIILFLILKIFKIFSYDIPQKKRTKKPEEFSPAADTAPEDTVSTAVEDDSELIAVLCAAIVAYNSDSNEALPFRVVSYRRVKGSAGWIGNEEN